MPAPSPATAQRRARLAGLSYHRDPQDPAVVGARRELELSKLEDHVTKIVTDWPELTTAQLDRIAALLRAGATGGDSDAT
jgi:hypothetical protein